MAPSPELSSGPPALEEPRSVLSYEGIKVDSCVGLAPTNDRVAAGRFGFFSLQEEMVRRPGNAPGWSDARLFYRQPRLFTELSPQNWLQGRDSNP